LAHLRREGRAVAAPIRAVQGGEARGARAGVDGAGAGLSVILMVRDAG
jgi:hypothetical protein